MSYNITDFANNNLDSTIGGSTPNGFNSMNVGKGVSIATPIINTGMQWYGENQAINDLNVQDYTQGSYYNPRSLPPIYQEDVMPDDLAQKNMGWKRAGTGALQGASLGTMIAPGPGTAIGAVVGGVAGALTGRAAQKNIDRKRAKFQSIQEANKSQYKDAVRRYYDIQSQREMDLAQQRMNTQRSQNLNPYFSADIYGYGTY